jgi:hypothetical protein
MYSSKEIEKNVYEENKDIDFKVKKEEKCVCINVFVKCEKDHKKEEYPCKENKEKKEDCCVTINVFAECED